MANIINEQFSKYDPTKGFVSIDNLYVEYTDDSGNKQKVSIDKLFYGVGKEASDGSRKTKSITSYEQFVAQAGNGNIYLNQEGNLQLTVNPDEIKKKNIEIPTAIDSYGIDTASATVPYGLKRNVTMNQDTAGSYALVKIDGELTYIKKASIYFFTADGKKNEVEGLKLDDPILKDKMLFDGQTGRAISDVYSGELFEPDTINSYEAIDSEFETKVTYVKKDDGTYEADLSTKEQIDGTFSEHTYIQKTIEGKAGKSETARMISIRNFVLDQGEDFIVVGDKKIALKDITKIEQTLTATDDFTIIKSDLKAGKEITYTSADGTEKQLILKDEIIDTLTTDEFGKKKIKDPATGEEIYLDSITKITYSVDVATNGPITQDNLVGNSEITVAGVVDPIKISEGQAIVYPSAGDHVYVTVNGKGQMVPISSLRDAENNKVTDITKMVGKKLTIIEAKKNNKNEIVEVPVAVTDELTYEQANMRYSTRKSFQPSEKTKADNTTYRKLVTGEMVKESMINVPKAYKKAPTGTTEPPAWLVEIEQGGVKRFVILDDKAMKERALSGIMTTRSPEPLLRCDVGDPNCIAIQTTSRGEKFEECKYLEDITDVDKKNEAKEEASAAVTTGIENGQYIIDDAKNKEGEYEKLEADGKRYEYTDTITVPDYAASKEPYSCLSESDITIKNGEVIGGIHYEVGKAFKKDFSRYGNIMSYGPTIALASIFIPIVGPLAAVAYGAVAIGGPLFIAGKNVINAAQKNNWQIRKGKPFPDKAKVNQQAIEKEVKADVQALYERLQNKNITLDEFEHQITTLKQKAYALSRATDNSSIVAVNGTAKVTKENANAAIKYKNQYADTNKQIAKAKKDLEKAQKHKKSDIEIQKITARLNHYEAKFKALQNGEFTEQSLDAMQKNTERFLAANNVKAKVESKIAELENQIAKKRAAGKDVTHLLEQLAEQKKLQGDNELILNEELARSENLNSNKTRKKAVERSQNFDRVLDSIEDMRAIIYIQKFPSSPEVQSLIAGGLISLTYLSQLGYDVKLGLTINGKSIDKQLTATDCAIIRANIKRLKEIIQTSENTRNNEYEDLSQREERAAATTTKNEEVEASRKQEKEARQQIEADKELKDRAKQEREARKTTELPNLRNRKRMAAQELRKKKTQLETLQRDLPQHKEALNALNRQLADTNKQIDIESANNTTLNNIKVGNEEIKVKMNEKIKELKMQLTSPKSENVAAYINEKIKKAREDIHNADLEIMKVEKPLQESQDRLNNLLNSRSSLQNIIRSKENLINSEAALISEVQQKEQEFAQIEEQLKALEEQVERDDRYEATAP